MASDPRDFPFTKRGILTVDIISAKVGITFKTFVTSLIHFTLKKQRTFYPLIFNVFFAAFSFITTHEPINFWKRESETQTFLFIYFLQLPQYFRSYRKLLA